MNNRLLILSDGRAGHVSQSIALAKYLQLPHDVVEVFPKWRWSKGLSYIFDNIGVYTSFLFEDVPLLHKKYVAVIGTGSLTYYMVKVLAKKLKVKSIVMMLPQGYRYDFDIIFVQKHDTFTKGETMIEVPANFAFVEPQGIFRAQKKAVGIIIGGDNNVFSLSKEKLQLQLDAIVKQYKGYEIAVTTSPRTSKEIETLIASYHFGYEVIFSKHPINPIPDFLDQCETVCITGDSTSMISEAISYGKANVVVLPLQSSKKNKFERFVKSLEKEGYLHIFDGQIEHKNRKINFLDYIPKGIK